MAYKLKTALGKAIYGARKCTVEPVIGIIKEVLGFRQFSDAPESRPPRASGAWSVWPSISSASIPSSGPNATATTRVQPTLAQCHRHYSACDRASLSCPSAMMALRAATAVGITPASFSPTSC